MPTNWAPWPGNRNAVSPSGMALYPAMERSSSGRRGELQLGLDAQDVAAPVVAALRADPVRLHGPAAARTIDQVGQHGVPVRTVGALSRLGALALREWWHGLSFLSWTGAVAWLAWGALSAVQAVFLLEEVPEAQTARQEAKQVPALDRHARSYSRGALAAYERFLGWPVKVVLAVLWLGGLTLLGLCALVLYLAGSVLMRALAGA
jgi:hypothetical protein